MHGCDALKGHAEIKTYKAPASPAVSKARIQRTSYRKQGDFSSVEEVDRTLYKRNAPKWGASNMTASNPSVPIVFRDSVFDMMMLK